MAILAQNYFTFCTFFTLYYFFCNFIWALLFFCSIKSTTFRYVISVCVAWHWACLRTELMLHVSVSICLMYRQLGLLSSTTIFSCLPLLLVVQNPAVHAKWLLCRDPGECFEYFLELSCTIELTSCKLLMH